MTTVWFFTRSNCDDRTTHPPDTTTNNTTHNPPNHGQLLISVPPAAPRPKKITTDTIKGTDGINILRTISIFLKRKA
jgi:hypothetical protein